MYDFEIVFAENRSHPLHPLCVWACNAYKQLVTACWGGEWVGVGGDGGHRHMSFFLLLKTALV